MPEILTESFCERCGTRYTFESAQPKTARLKGFKVVSRGLKNFVMSDDTSLDEAMAAARSETDREVTSQQLDAFHKTFNFCMTCRQYTCSNCWNEVEGRCLTCAPNLGHEILPAPFPDMAADGGIVALNAEATNGVAEHTNGHGTNGNGHEPALAGLALAWPTSDLMREEDLPEASDPAASAETTDADEPEMIDAVARLSFLSGWPGPDPVTDEPAAVETADADSDAGLSGGPSVEPVADLAPPVVETAPVAETELVDQPDVAAAESVPPAGVDERAAEAAAQTSQLFQRFRPGQSLDDEIAAYERSQVEAASPDVPVADAVDRRTVVDAAVIAATATVVTPEPEAEPEAEVAPVAEADEVAAADETPEPAELAAAPAAEPAAAPAAPEPTPVEAAPAPRADVVEQPTWRIVALDPDAQAPGDDAPADAAPPIAATADPQWPTSPEWPSQQGAGLPFLNRPAAASGGIEALWAESAREVATAQVPAGRAAGGVQPCVSCGLSLSATARFCRRCGSSQV